MTTINTKERILDSALSLFSQNGYDGTSVEQIAAEVGIKAPSLYKHFKGKEAILNAILDSAECRYEEAFGSERHIWKLPVNKKEFVQVTMERVRFTMCDPMIRKIRMLLVQEQFRNEKLAEITTRLHLDVIQRMFAKIISGMMDTGVFRRDNAKMLSIELTAPAVLWIAKADRQPQFKDECLNCIEKHIRHFCDVYMEEKYCRISAGHKKTRTSLV